MFYSNSLTFSINSESLCRRAVGLKLNWTFWLSLFCALALSMILLSYLYLIGVNVSKTSEVKILKSKALILREENQKLSLRFSDNQSLGLLEEFAKNNNFIEVQEMNYIKIAKPVLVTK